MRGMVSITTASGASSRALVSSSWQDFQEEFAKLEDCGVS
jgi:hypothetical protein